MILKSLSVSIFSFCFTVLLTACTGISVQEDDSLNRQLFQSNQISICYDYDCNSSAVVDLKGQEWLKVKQLLQKPVANAAQERNNLAQAIALMEQLTGRVVGTWRDKAQNEDAGQAGQMDCIDESRNTTAYLQLFDQRGWLQWHQVQYRVMRSYIFLDVHWTAVIKDIQNNEFYAVDSWFRPNGYEPVVLKLDDWKLKKERP